MGTKNLFSIAALTIFGLASMNSVKAQSQSITDFATVNIRFQPVQTIEVNPNQKTVDLVYASVDDYSGGVSSLMEDHITVNSTGGFQVIVGSSGNFKMAGGQDEIPAGDMKIIPALGSGTGIGIFQPDYLTTSGHALIMASVGGFGLNYHITYDNTEKGKDHRYITKQQGGDETVYTAQVTYSIVSN